MKTVRKFTRDSMVSRISRALAAKSKPATAYAEHTRVPNATKPAVDLNEIHRSFWARLAGKE